MSSATSATWLLSIACSEIPVLCPTSAPKRQRFGCCAAQPPGGSRFIGAEPEKRDAPAAVEVRLRDEVLHPVEDLLEQGALEQPRLEHGGVCCVEEVFLAELRCCDEESDSNGTSNMQWD